MKIPVKSVYTLSLKKWHFKIVPLFILMLFCLNSKSETDSLVCYEIPADTICGGEIVSLDTCTFQWTENTELQSSDSRPNPILQMFKQKQKKNKKITAAILAFPFPFGIVGLHRIYLGTSPHVPVVYIASLGGVFGILPFIDFCVLVLDKDIDRYINNKKVFMWVK